MGGNELLPLHLIFATGMASLVEFDFAVNQAGLSSSSTIAEQLDCEVQDLDLEDNIAEIWKKFDTPPLSPEHESSSCASSCVSPNPSVEGDCYDSEDPISDDPLLGQLLQCERLLALDEEESLSSDSPSSQNDLHFDLLLRGRDCMWNSTIYEPRNLLGPGVYTPAPSPPPAVEEEKKMTVETNTTAPSTACINPAAVFPTLLPPASTNSKQPKTSKVKAVKPAESEKPHKGKAKLLKRFASERDGRIPGGNARVQPQAIPSESGEY